MTKPKIIVTEGATQKMTIPGFKGKLPELHVFDSETYESCFGTIVGGRLIKSVSTRHRKLPSCGSGMECYPYPNPFKLPRLPKFCTKTRGNA